MADPKKRSIAKREHLAYASITNPYPPSIILYLVSCILYPVSCILHPASCILYPESYIPYPASRILHLYPASHIPHPLLTILTNPAYDHGRLCGTKTNGKLYCRNRYIVETGCFFAYIANEMYMVILVMALFAIVFAECIQY